MYDSDPFREDADGTPGLFQQRWRQSNISNTSNARSTYPTRLS